MGDLEKTSSRRGSAPKSIRQEEGYLGVGNEQVYYVRHTAKDARAVAVLAGPFAAERAHVYISWVRWARYLAARGIEVIRFDYRGTGESTGRFEDVAFSAWLEDLRQVAWLAKAGRPLILHGYRMGALLCAKAFAAGIGDAMLLWFPAKSARDMLYEGLRQRIMADFGQKEGERPDRDQYMAKIEAGEVVEVEGYPWTARLLAEANDLPLILPGPEHPRPHRLVKSSVEAGPLATPYARPPNPRARAPERPLNPDLSAFFASEHAWLMDAVTANKANA